MTLADRLDPRLQRRLFGSLLTLLLHLGFLLLILAGGRSVVLRAGDAPTSLLVMMDVLEFDPNERVEVPLPGPVAPAPVSEEQLEAAMATLAALPAGAVSPLAAEATTPQVPPIETAEAVASSAGSLPATYAMSDSEIALLSRRPEQFAAQSLEAQRTEFSWQHDDRHYSAVLTRLPAEDGTGLERVVAEVSTSDRGKDLKTTVSLRRLAFSQFTQMVDRWDPMVQLHDDEIVGRFHSNSQLKLLYDASTGPRFSGKVTTAARGFDTETRTRRQQTQIFREGVETRAGRIELPQSLQPFAWAPKDDGAQVHEFAGDTHIRFFPDGSYTFRARGASQADYARAPAGQPVYLVAAEDAALFVQGVATGRILVYSPQRIVIEGSLTYANDPRESPDSGDFVGLVSNRYVEIAPPSVTGPGDIEIDAAIFAGRRFVVRNFEHSRGATLRIFGSLTAGSLSASEPRYATRIEYDRRFERQRPPGFPSTDRFEAAEWDGEWAEAPERTENGPT